MPSPSVLPMQGFNSRQMSPFGRPMYRTQNFGNADSMRKYKTFNNPRTTGAMDVTDAVMGGGNVMQWLPSSGAGPGTRGYMGSGGKAWGFHTGRPSARTSGDFYRNRDEAIGNPLDELKRHGPNRGNIMAALMDEARGTSTDGMETRTNPDGSTSSMPDWSDDGSEAPLGDNGFGTVIRDGKQVPLSESDLEVLKQDASMYGKRRPQPTFFGPPTSLLNREIEGPPMDLLNQELIGPEVEVGPSIDLAEPENLEGTSPQFMGPTRDFLQRPEMGPFRQPETFRPTPLQSLSEGVLDANELRKGFMSGAKMFTPKRVGSSIWSWLNKPR